MSKLPLTIACWDYDRVRGLMDGRVPVDGCDINFLPLGVEETFFRAFRHAEFDACELSFSTYLMNLARERDEGIPFAYIAMPVFISRVFRHSGIYIRTDSGIKEPADLKGRVAGVPEYQMTAAVWIRGILEHEYGVTPADMRWVNGGLEEPGRIEKTPLTLPAGVEMSSIGPEKTLSGMLEVGELDVLVTARAPSCYDRGAPNVGRLFPNFGEVERAYYKKTGNFPMMHVIGVKKSLLEANPWLGACLYKAFIQAKQLIMPELTEVAALKVSLPWVAQEAEDTMALMGKDFWPYGVDNDDPSLESFLNYHFEQGLSGKAKFAPEDIFIPSTLERFKV